MTGVDLTGGLFRVRHVPTSAFRDYYQQSARLAPPHQGALMPSLKLAIAVAISFPCFAWARGDDESTIWSALKQGPIDRGTAVSIPSQDSDYLNVTYSVVTGSDDQENGFLAQGLPVKGVAVSVSDFGSGRTYPRIGMYRSNLGLDASGQTPDLASPLAEVLNPPLNPPPLFQFVGFDLPEALIPAGDTRAHSAVQLPPGDSGLLGVGSDSNLTSASGQSAFTTDGYITPAQ